MLSSQVKQCKNQSLVHWALLLSRFVVFHYMYFHALCALVKNLHCMNCVCKILWVNSAANNSLSLNIVWPNCEIACRDLFCCTLTGQHILTYWSGNVCRKSMVPNYVQKFYPKYLDSKILKPAESWFHIIPGTLWSLFLPLLGSFLTDSICDLSLAL